ncbi:hypothetical protein J6590_086955 [Homalodisca vitripennis]|nr:hypothetical protein J6590_086955 [Homalodisca vitripennis]
MVSSIYECVRPFRNWNCSDRNGPGSELVPRNSYSSMRSVPTSRNARNHFVTCSKPVRSGFAFRWNCSSSFGTSLVHSGVGSPNEPAHIIRDRSIRDSDQ